MKTVLRLINSNKYIWGLFTAVNLCVYFTLSVINLVLYPITYLFISSRPVRNNTTIQKNMHPIMAWFGNPEDGVYWDWEVREKMGETSEVGSYWDTFTWNAVRNPCYGYLNFWGEDTIDIENYESKSFGKRSQFVVFNMKDGRKRYFVDYKEDIPFTKGKYRFDWYVGLKHQGLRTIRQFTGVSNKQFNDKHWNRTRRTRLEYIAKYELDDIIHRKGFERIHDGVALRVRGN